LLETGIALRIDEHQTMNADNEPTDNVEQQVHDAYRALANEHTPSAVDRAILQQASAAVQARRRYLPPTWTRPLAFAATLILGVALLHEMQLDQGSQSTVPSEQQGPAVDARDFQAKEDRQQSPPAKSTGDRAAAPETEELRDAAVSPEPDTLRFEAPSAADATSNATPRSREQVSHELKPEGRRDTLPGSTQDATAMLPEKSTKLEKLNRRKSASEADTAALSSVGSGALIGKAHADKCDSKQTATPESWIVCIETLRKAGDNASADAELVRLREHFPDFPEVSR
jgi:hypothetical protein